MNVSALEADGIEAATTGEAIALTSLMSTVTLIALFGTGFAATAGRHISHQCLIIAGIALFLVVAVLAVVLALGAHPAIAGRAGHWAAKTSSRLASLARTALTGRAFLASFGFASADLLFDLLSLDLMFLALRYQAGFGPLAVACAAANLASAIPLAPGGLGVIEVTMVALTVGFGALRPTAVLAVLGYRVVTCWLSLLPRCRGLSPAQAPVSQRGPAKARDAAVQPVTAGLIHLKFTLNSLFRTNRGSPAQKHVATRSCRTQGQQLASIAL